MRTLWILALAAALLSISAGNANAADKKTPKKGRAAMRTAQPIASDTKPTRSDINVAVELPLVFDGEVLTEARAEELAALMGFTLIDFHRCSTGENCAIFEVAGPAGRIFQYQVLGTRCKIPKSTGTIPNDALDDLVGHTQMSSKSARKANRTSQSARSASPETAGSISTSPIPGGVVEQEEGNVSSCFAGYKMLFRARQENTMYADHLGFSTKVAQFYQTVENGRWLDVYNASASNWKFARVNSGITDKGWAYEIRYPDGTLRSSDSYAVEMIASGVGAGQTAGEMCGGMRDALQGDANITTLALFNACKARPLPDSGTIGAEGSLEPWGVGVSLNGSVTKTNDTCENDKQMGLEKNAVAATSLYNDCMQHPGRYYPNIFPPEDGALTLDALVTAINPQYIENGSLPAGTCPSSIVNYDVAVDMGNGSHCTADAVRYTCNTKTDGSCYCDNPKVEGAIICTDNQLP